MITIEINTEKLHNKGIETVEVEFNTEYINPAIEQVLARSTYSSDDVQVFSLTIKGHDNRAESVAILGNVDAVLHRNTKSLMLSDNLKSCKSVVFIYTLYIETDFSGCGIASYILERLHIWVKQELGCAVDAVLLAPVPQYKNKEGAIVQVPIGVEYFIQVMKLIDFYKDRGFEFCDDLLIMAKPT